MVNAKALAISLPLVMVVLSAASILAMVLFLRSPSTTLPSLSLGEKEASVVTLSSPPALASSYTLTLPPTSGAAAQVLVTDGSGITTWATPTDMTFSHPTNSNTVSNFATRADFVQAVAIGSGLDVSEGMAVQAGGDFYRRVSGSTAIPDLPDWVPLNEVWVEHFGAVTIAGRGNASTSKIDNAAPIQAALDYINLLNGGTLYLRGNYYRVGAPLVAHARGLALIGAGDEETYIFGDHTLGPVLQITRRTTLIARLCIDASDARREASSDRNYGILYETPPDEGGYRLQNSVLNMVRIQNQPSHGLYISVTAYTGSVTNCWMINNGGHGVLIDRGTESGVEHPVDVSGLVSFRECQVRSNGGNGFALGNPKDVNFTTQALRIEITNVEMSGNGFDASARWANSHVYLHGATSVLFKTNVFSSSNLTGSSGIFIQGGRSIYILNNRFIGVKHAVVIDTYVTLPTVGVFIEAFDIITSSDEMTEAILVQNTSGDPAADPSGIYINNYNYTGGVKTLVGTGEGMSGGSWRVPQLGVGGRTLTVLKREAQQVSSATLLEDGELKFWVTPKESIAFSLVLGYVGPSLKLRMTAPPGAFLTVGPVSGVKVGANGTVVTQDAVGPGVDMVFGGDASFTRMLKLVGVVTAGVDAGKVGLWWAQNAPSSSGVATAVLPNVSHLVLNRVAR